MYTYNATITNVVNGNTVDADIDLGFSVVLRQRVKLYGVEIIADKETEAKEQLKDLLKGDVVIETMLNKRGKYGRIMGKLFVQDDNKQIDVNRHMVDKGFAQKFETK